MQNDSTQQETDLHTQLSESVEEKTEGNFSQGWDFDNIESNTEPAKEEQKETEAEQKTEPGKKGKTSEAVLRASAETATAMLDTTLTGICMPLVNRKFRKRFKPDELNNALDIQDRAIDSLTDEEQKLRLKFDREMKKRDAKVKAIPLSTDEERKLNQAFYNYFKIKDIALPPELVLVLSLSSIIGDRVIEIAID